MITRVAGAFDVDPNTRAAFVRSVTAAFSQAGPVEVWSVPVDEPVLTLIFGSVKRPAVTRWLADDGSAAVIDGDFYGFADDPRDERGLNLAHQAFRHFVQSGRASLKRLRGDAAYVFYQADQRRLTIARDARGAAPLFYAPLMSGGVLFASDQVTLARAVPRTLDTNALDYFLARGYVPAPWTMIREVRKLPASYMLEAVAGDQPKVMRYAWPTGRPQISPPLDERNAEIGRLFAQSLRRRHPPGAPSAVMLSGGVDSTMVLAGLVRLLGEKPECFTFEYGDYTGTYNEASEAAQVAAHFDVAHHRIACRPGDVADRAADLVAAYGEPFTYGLHSFALDHLIGGPGPVFTGIGSEPWGINNSGLATLRFRQLPGPLRLLGRTGLAMAKPFAPDRVGRAGVLVWSDQTGLPPALAPSLLNDGQRRLLYTDTSVADRGVEASYDLLREAAAEFDGESMLDQWRFLQQRSFGAEAVYQWNAAWARNYGLEMRHPYLDDDLNAYMSRLTFSTKGKENQRNYGATLLPEKFAKAHKVFHTIPIANWFRGPLKDFLRSTLDSRALNGVLDKAVVTHLLDMHLTGRADHGFTLWGLASFALWSQQVLHAPARSNSSFIDISTRAVEQQRP